MWQGSAGEGEESAGNDGIGMIELIPRQHADQGPQGETRIAHQDLQASEGRDRGLDQARAGGGVSKISQRQDSAATPCFDLGRDRLKASAIALGVEQHLATRSRQGLRRGGTDSGPRARDQN